MILSVFVAVIAFIAVSAESGCVPYSEEACREAAEKLGLTIGSSKHSFTGETYSTKGCFSYKEGEFAGQAYYGLGGQINEMIAKPKAGVFRPAGYDCVEEPDYVIKDGPGICTTVTLEHCRAIADVNVDASFEETDPSVPIGCYKWDVTGKFYFNHDDKTDGECAQSTLCYCQDPCIDIKGRKQCKRRKADGCVSVSKKQCVSKDLLTPAMKDKLCKKGSKKSKKCTKISKRLENLKFQCSWDEDKGCTAIRA